MITKLIGMVDSVTGSLQTQTDRDTVQTGNSEHPNQDIITMENKTMVDMPFNEQSDINDTSDNAGPGSDRKSVV